MRFHDHGRLRPRVEMMLQNAGITPRSRIETANSASACAFAANGLGVALVDPFSASLFSGMGIVVRPFDPTMEIEIAVMRPQEVTPSASGLTRHLITLLGETLERHATAAPLPGEPR